MNDVYATFAIADVRSRYTDEVQVRPWCETRIEPRVTLSKRICVALRWKSRQTIDQRGRMASHSSAERDRAATLLRGVTRGGVVARKRELGRW